MMPVQRAPEPTDFDARVRRPGQTILLELIGRATRKGPGRKRKPVAQRIEDIPAAEIRKAPLWQESIPALRTAYRDTCAYLAMKIHPATGATTVDHFIPLNDAPDLAYEWSNFRLCSLQMNRNKLEYRDVLDPFEIKEGWFVPDIGTFEVRPGEGLAEEIWLQVEATIARLRLNEPTFVQARSEYHDRYLGLGHYEPLPFTWLEVECPFVASELRRQGRLR